jgi:hypothetical protein
MGHLKTDARRESAGAEHELYDRRTAYGLAMASGDVLAIVEDYGAPAPDWCERVLIAHQQPHGVIGGAVENEGSGNLNRAVYLLDFGRYQLPLAEGPADYLTDVNVSYKRSALESIRELWAQRYNEVVVHWALSSRGVTLWRDPRIIVCEDRGALRLSSLLRERVAWGRLFGATRARSVPLRRRVWLALASPALPVVLVGRALGGVFARGRERVHSLRVLPELALLAAAWSVGEALGYWSGAESR